MALSEAIILSLFLISFPPTLALTTLPTIGHSAILAAAHLALFVSNLSLPFDGSPELWGAVPVCDISGRGR